MKSAVVAMAVAGMFLGLAYGATAGLRERPRRQAAQCPLPGTPETAEDCPWAGLARELDAVADAGAPLGDALDRLTPGIAEQVRADRGRTSIRDLWGESINYDEGARGLIVRPEVVDALLALADLPARRDRVVHAGVEHTYGYLFSNLVTPFGYKRARWVRDDVERGLGLPRGSLGPIPEAGTLLGNATQLFGRVALADDTTAMALLELERDRTPTAVIEAAAALPRALRLSERFSFDGADGRRVDLELRSDFLEFRTPDADERASSHLLIYSVRDSRRPFAQLITAFPMNRASVRGALDSRGLGADREIRARYNAFVEDVTGRTFRGARELEF
jgi:hypothetical protein